MKKTSLVFASMIFAGSAVASDFNDQFAGDPELYGGHSGSAQVPTATQPGIGDSYGGSLFENTSLQGLAQSSGSTPKGSGEAYGSNIPNVESGDLDW